MLRLLTKRDGHDLDDGPALNPAGVAYTTFVIIYTGLLLYGIGILWLHRRKPAVRIRGFLITAAAVLSIHCYVAALFVVYPLNGWFKCGTEFWYMNTVFPLGVALFQASNVRLMAYSKAQHGLLELKCFGEKKEPFGFHPSKVRKWFGQLDYLKKTYACIGLGFVFQICLTFFLFFGSRRFSPDTGFFGEYVGALNCRRGYEWIPSVLWQFLWTWFFGPWVLFRTRNVRDTHFWALQTRLAVIAGLPGTPLWLAFLYSNNTSLGKVSMWWLPAMWFAPGLIVMQVSALVLPAIDIYRHRPSKKLESVTSTLSTVSTTGTVTSHRKSKELANNYKAFEFQLKHNLYPLLAFSTERDFTSENILFLREVRDFKLKWRRYMAQASALTVNLSPKDYREMYEDAARIFFELVMPGTAKFPINIDSKTYFDIERCFRGLGYEPPSSSKKRDKEAGRAAVAPWESPMSNPVSVSSATPSNDGSSSETALIDIGLDGSSVKRLVIDEAASNAAVGASAAKAGVNNCNRKEITDEGLRATPTAHKRSASGNVKSAREEFKARIFNEGAPCSASLDENYVAPLFTSAVFDKAEESVKYLVYTNTWKSFVGDLDGAAVDQLSDVSSGRIHGRVPRRGREGALQGKMSHITDVEMYDLDLEQQEKREGNGLKDLRHRGLLDSELADTDTAQADTRCASCRKKRRN